MLHFMYQGEVNIKQEDISSFLKLAETLQIKGLTTEKTKENSICAENEKEKDSYKTELCEDSEGQNVGETVSQRLEDSFGSPCRERSPSVRIEKPCVQITSSKVVQQPGTDSKTESVMQSVNRIFEEKYEEKPNEMETMNEEPLDYTSEVRPQMEKIEEPLNYRLNTNNQCPQDFVSRLPYGQNCEREILGKPSRKISPDWKIFF